MKVRSFCTACLTASILTLAGSSWLYYANEIQAHYNIVTNKYSNSTGQLCNSCESTAGELKPSFIRKGGSGHSFCSISFSFQLNDLNCKATKTLKIFSMSSISCPYVHPYLEIKINDRFMTTVLAELTGSSRRYVFGNSSIPAVILFKVIEVRICSYFNSSFDILKNVDERLDLNDGAKSVNTVLLDWEQVFPWPSPQNKSNGAMVCTIVPGADAPIKGENNTQCTFTRYTPGFWDSRERAFLPAGCSYLVHPRNGAGPAPGGRVWVHFLGDSNMRSLHAQACQRIRSPRTHTKNLPGGSPTLICLSPGGNVALAFTTAWMHAKSTGGAALLGESSALLGGPLAPLLCPMAPSPGCAVAWNRTADRTLALVGSHYAQQLIPRSRADVATWIKGIAARLPRRTGALAVLLTCSVCIGWFNSTPQYWVQLFQRNNYRLRAVNDATLAAAREVGAAAADLFSMTLAAGCGAAASKDVVHFHGPVYAAQADALFSLLADVL
jgi:hypothetical protein